MNPIWKDTATIPRFEELHGDISTDVLIIGGGLAGLLTAIELTHRGAACVLIEADRISSKTTARTTAKVTSQHGLIYHKLLSSIGKERASQYLLANERAVAKYRAMSEELDFDFEEKSSYIYSQNNRKILETELSAIEKLGGHAEYAEKLALPLKTVGAVKFTGQAQMNPQKLVAKIAPELRIYENTRATELRDGEIICERGRVRAKEVVVATHFPIFNNHGFYFMKMHQDRSYVIGLEGASDPHGMYLDESPSGYSFRTYGKYLLFGGGGHRTGERGGGYTELRLAASELYPSAREVYAYATQDCMTLDGVPYIGKYSRGTDNLYVITGFNKWGMTSSMVASELISSLIFEEKNELSELYSPSRSMLTPSLFKNLYKTTRSLLTLKTPRCPHLGCALKYNRAEHSWDCPCHGSRFDEDGKLLDNPANGDMKKKNG